MPQPPKALLSTPEETEHAFYEALDHADLEAVMAVWAEHEEVSCIHPGGPRLQGYAAIRAAFAEIFKGGAIHIRPSVVHVVAGAAVTVHHVVEHIVIATPAGQKLVQVLATNVYHKTDQGWRLVIHHASPALVDQDGQPPVQDIPERLH
ncbi:YybH family protein [Parvibium lacunae]|uniref:DUF4440 domain-containing protein n=1 Tax=Parvibium lacunae TaxID=1888893 RepID=A0A368L0C1_9BURK|nr:nuclear transport factor 2 family protein [Parvibium lacunae]RCS56731.1 DUF4440 domain-containing protein [Parvibium lacunae]